MINIRNNKVSLTAPDKATFDEWALIAGCANKTGYAIGEADDAKRVYSRLANECGGEYVFNDDIAALIRQKIEGIKPKELDEGIKSECISAVTDHFGTTSNTALAGYLTPNGDFLKFSYDNYMRDMDHREVSEILVEKGVIPEEHEYSDALIAFMDMGNIRIQDFGVDISVNPNRKQWDNLDKVFRRIAAERGEVIVDISTKNDGITVASMAYEMEEIPFIEDEVGRFFDTGLLPRRAA